VEGRGGLVEDEERGRVQRSLHDPDQRSLSRGELVAHRVAEVRDGESLEPRLDRGDRVVEPVELPEEAQELADAQPLGQRQVPGGEADTAGGGAAMAGRAEPGDLDPTAVRRDDAEEHEQGRGVAGAVGPEEPEALTGADGE